MDDDRLVRVQAALGSRRVRLRADGDGRARADAPQGGGATGRVAGEVYPPAGDEQARRAEVADCLKAADEVVIGIDLGMADGSFTVYGCDLTEGHVRPNSEYTT